MKIANYMHLDTGEGRATIAISIIKEGNNEVAYNV
jgi:hypothetical protein